LQHAKINNSTSLKNADLSRALLNGATIAKTNIEGSNFTGASLTHAQFYIITFKNVNLTDANLTSVDLESCNFDNIIVSKKTNVTRAIIQKKHAHHFKDCLGYNNACIVDSDENNKEQTNFPCVKAEDNKKIEILKNLMKCYTDKWMGDCKNWIKFTVAFKTAFHNNYYEVYDDICSKFSGYNAENNRDMWNKKIDTRGSKHLNFISFRHWAKKQNPTLYHSEFSKENKRKLKELKKLVEDNYSEKWASQYKNWIKFTMAFKNTFYGNYYDEWCKICSKYLKFNEKRALKTWSQVNIHENSVYGFDSFKLWASQQNEQK